MNSSVGGKEIIIGNNPYKGVWCFDGDNSDELDEGISITPSYFPSYPREMGDEGIDWDVVWIFNTSGNVIATPAIGDVDQDGWLEVVVGDLSGTLYILNASDGREEWNFTTDGAIYSSPSIRASIKGSILSSLKIKDSSNSIYPVNNIFKEAFILFHTLALYD